MLAADVQLACSAPDLPEPGTWEAWAVAALRESVDEGLVVVRVVGEEEGRALNEEYRGRLGGKLGATNVLAFPFELPPGIPDAWQAPGPGAAGPSPEQWQPAGPPLLGDVVVCLPVARREAHDRGLPLPWHLAHLTVHGVLHLLGYRHETPGEAGVMEDAERRVLARFGIPDPYAGEGEAPEAADDDGGGAAPEAPGSGRGGAVGGARRSGAPAPADTPADAPEEQSGRSRHG